MVALFAVSCGISAANLYYAQPLLPLISRDLHAGSGGTALVVTAAQVGYGVGLALIVPLGDILIRRRLVPGILLVAAGALLAASAAPDIVVLMVAVAIAGLCSVAAQILVPYAAELAIRPATGTGGRHGDERVASRDPAGPHLLRADRRGRRMAHRVRGGRGDGPGAGRSSSTAGCPARQRRSARLRAAAGLGGPPHAHRAAAPPAVRHRRAWSSPPST